MFLLSSGLAEFRRSLVPQETQLEIRSLVVPGRTGVSPPTCRANSSTAFDTTRSVPFSSSGRR